MVVLILVTGREHEDEIERLRRQMAFLEKDRQELRDAATRAR